MADQPSARSERHCWLRLRRHDWLDTGAVRIIGGPFNRGCLLRCKTCGHEAATVNRDVIARAEPFRRPRA